MEPAAKPDLPLSTSKIDDQLRRTIVNVHRARWIVLILFGVLVTVALVVGSVVISSQQSQLRTSRIQLTDTKNQLNDTQRQLHASCGFWSTLSQLPLTITPPAVRPAKLLVEVVITSREAYIGGRCGITPPLSAQLAQWAAYYRISVS